jgi:hypothetical protein
MLVLSHPGHMHMKRVWTYEAKLSKETYLSALSRACVLMQKRNRGDTVPLLFCLPYIAAPIARHTGESTPNYTITTGGIKEEAST